MILFQDLKLLLWYHILISMSKAQGPMSTVGLPLGIGKKQLQIRRFTTVGGRWIIRLAMHWVNPPRVTPSGEPIPTQIPHNISPIIEVGAQYVVPLLRFSRIQVFLPSIDGEAKPAVWPSVIGGQLTVEHRFSAWRDIKIPCKEGPPHFSVSHNCLRLQRFRRYPKIVSRT